MTSAAYFDTCSLLCWAFSRLPDCNADDVAAAPYVERVINESRVTAVSAVTLLEFYDVAALAHRSQRVGADEAWLAGSMNDLAAWQADARLVVLDSPPKLFEHAMRYVKLNTDAGPYKFRSMDAAHLVHVVRWSRGLDAQIELISFDKDYTKLVGRYPGFARYFVQVDPRTGSDLTARA